ncbi:MAG: ribosome recycling factor [Candidatus Taylorbacteria bacterium RIFCSPHIGHO2_02_FULL_45_28]|uniref:Ribosome recycling factor n=1 Tax=Candidatus Taylorbacteria bacterium RIFCSPHIGHO2_12_FULL_45_16 TaxID=1802315 RepID=A0A1G2N1V4_9BACT|nr:MAG: ribosome recycling factor [Candidatus Taylorbacteria bacterium RIFCSPHIGHO2_01_FULL_44_110]OHA25524.1 MAG: ribosome recycling factor [Candidatus Taylorbacteria bacterium RIFCSPHIGHO2_02_FULL_45_28]OHA29191.1 MAG: ribosome recycling factor [Candidatus Taylorbacteria bacterium RIFCSPHIGHO2_12_FULL_45_16]OHA33413.1 MAG: ribosome recycling factor [Candidatus Taylorbacteria bacterium RIFCSPLOWO2_01_FULL_45_59]OHA39498.1 MAG: ribosome recycling factor [Candidatus Taylorbacteria bacterium RIFC
MSYDFNQFKKQLASAEEWLKKELSQIRTGQASPAILDAVKVEIYGAPMSIKEVASVVIESARTLRIAPWDKSQTKEIEKAITVADLGLSVVVDDQGLRVMFPELTGERRQQIAKSAKEKLEEAKKEVRGYRDVIVKDLQMKEKDGEMGKDDAFRCKNDTQKLVDDINKKLDEMYAKKEKELLS